MGPKESSAKPPQWHPFSRDKVKTIREALEELYRLLEEYSPTWYTEEHHQRTETALRILRKT